MKFTLKITILSLALATILQGSAEAQQTLLPADSIKNMVTKASRSDPSVNMKVLNEQLKLLVNSKNENDLLAASNYYYQLKKVATSDSISEVAKKRFPKGYVMRSAEVDTISKEKDPYKKEMLFKQWIAKYPPSNFEGIRILYDYQRSGLAHTFAIAKNGDKAMEYANQLEERFWRGEGWFGLANQFIRQGDTARALPLMKRAIESSKEFLNPAPDDNKAQFAAAGYGSYNMQYAEFLAGKKRFAEALPYIKEADTHSKYKTGAFYTTYASILTSLGRNEEALAQLEIAIKAGLGDSKTKDALKKTYAAVKKDTSGFEAYQADLTKQMAAAIKEKVGKELINEPAAAFSLKDLNGKMVSLADMKGKVVVLDFWATWCGPCIRSFPAMQKAVNKYKNDPNVQFIFIDTWENAADYDKLVREFIATNKYDFNVLFDPRNKENKISEAATAYKVEGIPAKFVIDGNGRIRFKLTGFSGGDDAAVQELSTMIELAKRNI